MQVMLSDEQTKELKEYIFEITKKGIDEARKSAGVDRPFLKQKYMAEWLGVSVTTLKSWEKENLPTIIIDGVKLYSKSEVAKWVMQYQK